VGSLDVDGCRIRWDEAGTGTPHVLLLHGWCCDASCMRPQLAFLAARHRVVAPDLPWHGGSGAPGAPDLDRIRDLLAAFAARIGLERPVVVGHSMGGGLALQLGTRTALAPAAAVLLDARIDRPGDALHAAREKLVARLRQPDHAAVLRRFVLERFAAPDDDPAVMGPVADLMAAAPQAVQVELMAQMNATDWLAELVAFPAPVLAIGAATPVVPLPSLTAARPDVATAQVVGAGHFLQLVVPDQVNAMLRRFLDRLSAGTLPRRG
jgi:pimeloyl-ACP methyl ester carboxylesterase